MQSAHTSRPNGRATAQILISIEAPRPYLDEGEYIARTAAEDAEHARFARGADEGVRPYTS